MAETLRGLFPTVFPDWRENENWIPVPHRGKSDLEKSIPIKMRGWREPGVRFVIVRDNDGGDCSARKKHLHLLTTGVGVNRKRVLIRIVCQQLESWFLGDLDAVQAAYPHAKVSEASLPAKYRNPDTVNNASEELETLTGVSGKTTRAGLIAAQMRPERNRSISFRVFLDGVKSMAANP